MKYTKLNLRMLLEQGDDDPLDLDAEPDSPDAETADDEAADDEGDTATEEEEGVEIDPDDEVALRKPLEAQVDNMLADFELAEVKSAKVNEHNLRSLTFLLTEAEGVEFDIEDFATNVARLIDNYETLLDIESAIYYRAIAILTNNYGEEITNAFRDIMQSRYNFDFGDVRFDPVKDVAPLALGSGEGAGAGA